VFHFPPLWEIAVVFVYATRRVNSQTCGVCGQGAAGEGGQTAPAGVDLLKGMECVFLKRPENLSENQARDLNTALSKRWLATVRAYLLDGK